MKVMQYLPISGFEADPDDEVGAIFQDGDGGEYWR